jgi:hypothetical protein
MCSPQGTPKWPNSEPYGATRQQAIVKTTAKWSAHQIPSVIVVFVILVFEVYFVSLILKSHKRPWPYHLHRGVLVSTVLHVIVHVLTQFAEFTSTDWK